MAKMDVVFVERMETNGQYASYHFLDLEEAKKDAANLSQYHHEPFIVVVENIETFERPRKSVVLNKGAEMYLDNYKIMTRDFTSDKLMPYRM